MRAPDEIVLITYEFPFGSSETFLESEIEVLAKAFPKVWIIPSRATWGGRGFRLLGNVARRLPDNCTVILLERSYVRSIGFGIGNVWRLLRVVEFELASPTELLQQIRAALRETLKAVVFGSGLRAWISASGAMKLGYSYWKSEAATALALLKQRGDIRSFVTRCHGGDLYYEIYGRIHRPFDKFVFDQCSSVAVVSQHGYEYLTGRGVEGSKLHVARLGVRIVPPPCKPSDDGILRIMSCSSAIPLKRLDLLASALAKLDVAFEWIHFGDGPELPKVRELVRNFARDGAAFFPGRVSNRVVLEHYRHHSVDVFVNVSSSEGVPVSVMEALAAGVPCIVTDVGGSSEIIDDTCGRVLASSVTAGALAEQIRFVLTQRQTWIRRRSGAIRRARSLCNSEVNYIKFCDYLKSCAAD